MPDDIVSGIVIGAAGGAVAGLVLWLIARFNDYEIEWREGGRVYRWLDQATSSDGATK